MDRYAALRRRERVVAAARWFAVAFLTLHVVLSDPPLPLAVGDSATRAVAATSVALLAVVGVAAEVGIRLCRTRAAFERLGIALLVADVTATAAYVWLYGGDAAGAHWAVLALLPLEGAVRYQLAGSLAAWAGSVPSLLLPALSRETRTGINLADVLLPPLFLFVIALFGGLVGRDLERQVRVLSRLNRSARRIASRRDPEDVLSTLCEEAVRCLDARIARVLAVRDGQQVVIAAAPWREGEALAEPTRGVFGLALPWSTGEESLRFEVEPARSTWALTSQVSRALAESAAIAIATARVLEMEQRTNDRLRYLEALRRRFVATIAHDLRLPLTVFKGVAHVLRARRDEIAPQEVDDLLASVERQANRLARLADDLLDAARADAGRLALSLGECALRALVEQTAADFPEPVRVDIDESLTVVADRGRLDRIVWNLLSNAEKYGRPPYEVSARMVADGVQLAVRDHGAGLPDDVRDKLFEEFTTGGADGVGLGLAIVRQLARAHGGEVAYEDADPGARFIVTLPSDPQQGDGFGL